MNSLSRVFAVALNTVRESVRDKVLYAVVAAASTIITGVYFTSELAVNEETRVFEDLSIGALSLLAVLVALFLGSSLLYKEIERKTLYMVLPKPIHRWEFLVGKFFGIVSTGMLFIGVVGSLFFALLGQLRDENTLLTVFAALGSLGILVAAARIQKLSVPLACVLVFVFHVVLAEFRGLPVWPHLRAFVLISLELSLLTSVALLISSFSTPLFTALLSFGFWVIGRNADTLQTIESDVIPEGVRNMLHALAEVVPNFNLFVPEPDTVGLATDTPVAYLSECGIYAAAYVVIMMVAASVFFSRRELA